MLMGAQQQPLRPPHLTSDLLTAQPQAHHLLLQWQTPCISKKKTQDLQGAPLQGPQPQGPLLQGRPMQGTPLSQKALPHRALQYLIATLSSRGQLQAALSKP